jgi:hypothetical protein
MSDQYPVNLEFLKKQAKALLKQCRAGDVAAIARIRTSLPRLSTLNDINLAAQIKLSDVQRALASEQGYANWGAIKHLRQQQFEPVDFSKAGSHGVLPENFTPWRRVLSYTAHPELLAPTKLGQERMFVVSVLRKISNAEDPGYADLYERALTVVKRRASRLQCAVADAQLNTRIVTHGWFTHPKVNLARVFISLCAVYLREGEAGPEGLMRPISADLANQGGMTPENTALSPDQRVYESYVFGVHNDTGAPDTNIFTVSYGEYVPTCSGVDYGPFVQRAEDLAKFHFSMLRQTPLPRTLPIVRREWFCVTNPDIAVVHIYIQT